MSGTSTFPATVDTFFTAPASTDTLSKAPGHAYEFGSLMLAILAIENYLDAAPVVTNSVGGAAATLVDPRVAPMQVLTLTAAACTLTMPTATPGKSFMLEVIQDGTGNRTITWPTGGSAVRWNGGVPPTLSTAPGGIDIFVFCLFLSHWNGFVCGQGMA